MSEKYSAINRLLELAETTKDPHLLSNLANNPDLRVRRAVARNLETSPQTLKELVDDISKNMDKND